MLGPVKPQSLLGARYPQMNTAYTDATRGTMPTGGGINAVGGGGATPMSSFWKNWLGTQGKPAWAGHEFGPTNYPAGESAFTSPTTGLMHNNTMPTGGGINAVGGGGLGTSQMLPRGSGQTTPNPLQGTMDQPQVYHTMDSLLGGQQSAYNQPQAFGGGIANIIQQLLQKYYGGGM